MLAFLSKIVEDKLSSPEPHKFIRLTKLRILAANVGYHNFRFFLYNVHKLSVLRNISQMHSMTYCRITHFFPIALFH